MIARSSSPIAAEASPRVSARRPARVSGSAARVASSDSHDRPAELDAIAIRLLEVVADDLVQVGAFANARLDPAGELLVQRRTDLFRHRLVRRVADQDVAEPETVLADEAPPVGTDQLLADELAEAGRPTDCSAGVSSATAPQRNT